MTDRDDRIAYADAFRLMAIVVVVLHHVFRFTKLQVHGHLIGSGYIGVWGVDCFFALTGFLLSQRFFEAILGSKPFPSVKDYFLRRFLRIYPLYFVALVVTVAVVSLSDAPPSIANVVAHLTLTHGFFPPFTTSMNGPLWTMSVDAQFYIILPLIALVMLTLCRGRSEAERVRLIWTTLAVIVVGSIVERYIALSFIPLDRRADPEWDLIGVTCRNAVGMGANFAIGSALAFLGMRKPVATRPRWWYLASIGCGVVLLVLLARWPFKSHLVGPLYWVFADLLGGISAGSIMYGTLRGDFRPLTRMVKSRFVIRGAELAYSIYLFHFLMVVNGVKLYPGSLSSPLATLMFCIALLPPLLLVAELSHRFIELPGLRLRDQHREPVPTLP